MAAYVIVEIEILRDAGYAIRDTRLREADAGAEKIVRVVESRVRHRSLVQTISRIPHPVSRIPLILVEGA